MLISERPTFERLIETSIGTPSRVDRERGVIEGVKIVGHTSKNGRKYTPEALRNAIGLYEGCRVNINHPEDSPLSPRGYEDRFGAIKDVHEREDGLYGNLHFNPKHSLAEQVAWDAENAPNNLGLSHNVTAKTSRVGNSLTVEAIETVRSVDLVADPATTEGLFEQETPAMTLSGILSSLEDGSPAKAIIAAAAEAYGDIAVEGESPADALKAVMGAMASGSPASPATPTPMESRTTTVTPPPATTPPVMAASSLPSPAVTTSGPAPTVTDTAPTGPGKKETTEGLLAQIAESVKVLTDWKQSIDHRQAVDAVLAENHITPQDTLISELIQLPNRETMRQRVASWPGHLKQPTSRPYVETVQADSSHYGQDKRPLREQMGLPARAS